MTLMTFIIETALNLKCYKKNCNKIFFAAISSGWNDSERGRSRQANKEEVSDTKVLCSY